MERPSRASIHAWAAAGAAIAGALPVGPDAITLFSEEVAMTIKIAALFGEDITESAAKGVIAGAVGTVAGTAIFEVVNIGYPFTIPAKIAVAVGVIEALGNKVFDYYEKKYFG